MNPVSSDTGFFYGGSPDFYDQKCNGVCMEGQTIYLYNSRLVWVAMTSWLCSEKLSSGC